MGAVLLDGVGIYYLADAQGAAFPIAIGVLASLPVYFLAFDWIFPLVKERDTERNPFLATNETRGRVWIVALLMCILGAEAITFASVSSQMVATGAVTKKLLKRSKFGHPESWRVVLDNGLYFYVPFTEGNDLPLGTKARVTYRDAFFGVRFITSHEWTPANQALNLTPVSFAPQLDTAAARISKSSLPAIRTLGGIEQELLG